MWILFNEDPENVSQWQACVNEIARQNNTGAAASKGRTPQNLMQAPKPYTEYLSYTGHSLFLVLAIMAVCYFRERSLFLDTAFQSFEIIKNGGFAIQVNRFGVAFAQAFPLLAVKLGLPLKGVLIAYSLSFVLVHWALFSLTLHRLQQPAFALCIALFNILLVNHSFYWVQNEGVQAVSWCLFFWALLAHCEAMQKWTGGNVLAAAGLVPMLVFFHPLVVFPFFFTAFFFSIGKMAGGEKADPPMPGHKTLLLAVVAFILVLAAKHIFFNNHYDQLADKRLTLNRLWQLLGNPLYQPGTRLFWEHLLTDFYLWPPALLLVLIFYLRQKSCLKFLFVTGAHLAGWVMVTTAYQEGGYFFHIETQYLPLSIFVLLPLCVDVVPALFSHRRWLLPAVLLFGLIAGWRLRHIADQGAFYTRRIAYLEDLMHKATAQTDSHKFLLDAGLLNKEVMLQNWALPYETIHLSTLHSPDSLTVIYAVDDWHQQAWVLELKNRIATGMDLLKPAQLDPRYYNFRDTLTPTRLISGEVMAEGGE